MIKRVRKTLLLVMGMLALALGVLGIFLPVLPTTPFLLLSAWCFLRSSQRLYDWLLGHPLLGKYIYHYITFRAVPLRVKLSAIILLWGTLSVSVVVMQDTHLTILLAVVGLAVTTHLVCLKTLHEDKGKSVQELLDSRPHWPSPDPTGRHRD